MPEATVPRVVERGGSDRKRLGSWYTPAELVALIVDAVVTRSFLDRVGDRPIRVLDPACGDGRFLLAVAQRVGELGGRCDLVGVDIDGAAAETAARAVPEARIRHADALRDGWRGERFDLVIGNPPFLSQLAVATTRRGASELGGGPYADAAVEFLALADRLIDPRHGRVAFVLPQSVLAARDAGEVRERYDARAEMIWSWWTGELVFDAQVHTCALAFEFGGRSATHLPWSRVVTSRCDLPAIPATPRTAGTLGDRARLNANFRDEYYGMVPAVGDHPDGPPLITSGLIDPGVCHWGTRPVRFARRRFDAPRLDLSALDDRMKMWAEQRLVPKVLVANQTTVVEAVCDPIGAWLPGVPVVAAYPAAGDPAVAWEIAAVLTSPFASRWAWDRSAGTGLSASSIRFGPAMLAALPWPDGPTEPAVAALRAGHVVECGRAVLAAYGISDRPDLLAWWAGTIDRSARRRSTPPVSRPRSTTGV